jgi:pimeloyl-ACP methyl ester carboxylesterase
VRPDLVALHGFGDSGRCWQPFLQRVGLDSARVHTPDLLAHGGRPMPRGVPFGHEALVADARDMVAQVAASSAAPVVLLGHSLGASTAAGVAAASPHLVSLLVLEDPPWQTPLSPEPDARASRDPSYRDWLEGLRGTDHEGRLAWVTERHPSWPQAEYDPWAESKAQVDLALFAAEQHWLQRGWPAVARGVRCPTLLLVGDPGRDSACEAAVAAELASWPGWLVLTVSGAGHNVRRDRPLLLGPLLRGLLATYAGA